MKQYITLFALFTLIQASAVGAYAQSPTTSTSSGTPKPSVTKSQSLEDKIIENFKEKVATKVAELNKKNDKPAVGYISLIKGDTIEFDTTSGTYTAKVDSNLTSVFSLDNGIKKEIKTTDLKKGDYIIVSGPQLDKAVTANTIYKDEEYIVKSGKITEVNTDDVYLKIVSSDKDSIILDIPTRIRLQLLNSKTLEIEPVTLAKIKEGDTVHFVYKKASDQKDASSRAKAERVLIVPQEFFQK